MDVALKNLKLLKVGCFAHTLNLATQKVYSISAITMWCARLRSMVVCVCCSRSSNFSVSSIVIIYVRKLCLFQTSSSVDCYLKHNVILDVRTRWNSLFLMVERFLEQYPSYFLFCPRLERLTDDDFQKAEDFVKTMKLLYTSTLCESSEKSPTCGQILPIPT